MLVHPPRLEGRGRRRSATHRRRRSASRRCPWSRGSVRPAPRRRVLRRSCSRRRRSRSSRPARTSARPTPSTSTGPTIPGVPPWTPRSPRWRRAPPQRRRRPRLTSNTLSAAEASQHHAIDGIRPTIGEVIVTLDGKTIHTAGGPVKLSTAKVIGHGTGRRRQPNQDVVFDSLSLGARAAAHASSARRSPTSCSSPGSSLIVFEFFAVQRRASPVRSARWRRSPRVLRLLAPPGRVVGRRPVDRRRSSASSIDVQAGGLGPWTVIGDGVARRGLAHALRRVVAPRPGVVDGPDRDRGASSCSSCWRCRRSSGRGSRRPPSAGRG